ncbi:MAG TPA: PAS domain S-box protein [Sphingobacteriaceae bacterium]
MLEENPDFQQISQAINDGFVSLDSQWKFRYINNKALYLMQRTSEELLGRTLWETFPDVVGTVFEYEYHKVMYQRIPVAFETYYKTYSMWLEIRAYPQQGGICIFYSDISEKKMLEAERREIAQRFHLYAKMNPAGIFHIDGHGNCLFVNDKWIELTGISAKEASGHGWIQAFHEKDRARNQENWIKAIKAGKPIDDTYHFINKKTGLTLQAHIKATPINEDGTIHGYVGTIEDITETVKAREIIAESEKWFRNVANNAPVMICSIGVDRECTYVNKTWLDFTGRTFEDEVSIDCIDDVYPDDKKRVTKVFDNCFDNRLEFRTEYRSRFRDDSYRWISVTGRPLYSPDNTFMGFICSAVDINEQVMVYQELENRVRERTAESTAALEREKEVNNIKSRFVSMASHEFRTPLTTILSSVELMETYLAISELEHLPKHVDRIKSSVKHLRSILDDFLSVEKLEQGNVKNRKEVFDLREYIAETVDEVESLLKNNQHIMYNYSGDNQINSDKEIINHILFNLLSNAIKYSEKDVILDATVSEDVVCIDITDQGIGIPEEDQKYLFSNYFRASNVGSIKGTGLGLSIVKRYVEILEGSIKFTSTPGVGTKFTLRIPKSISPILINSLPLFSAII